MKKQILSIGNTLNKAEQKEVFGGGDRPIFVIGNLPCPYAAGCPCNLNGSDCGGADNCQHSLNAPDGYYGFCAY